MPNCASCGAPMHAHDDTGVLACQHCGSREELSVIARRVEVCGQSSRTCPTCATGLADGAIEGAPLLVCQRCEGLLIAMEHFISVIDAVRAHETPSRTIPPRTQITRSSRAQLSCLRAADAESLLRRPWQSRDRHVRALSAELARSGRAAPDRACGVDPTA